MRPGKFGLLVLPPAEFGNWLNVLLQPPAPHSQSRLFFFSCRNAGIKIWFFPIWVILSSNSTKLSDGQKTMGRTIPLKFLEQKHNWTGSKTNPASITFFFWAWLLLGHSESIMLSGYRRQLCINSFQLVTTYLYSLQNSWEWKAASYPCIERGQQDSSIDYYSLHQTVCENTRRGITSLAKQKQPICLQWEQMAMKWTSSVLMVVDEDAHGWITWREQK